MAYLTSEHFFNRMLHIYFLGIRIEKYWLWKFLETVPHWILTAGTCKGDCYEDLSGLEKVRFARV